MGILLQGETSAESKGKKTRETGAEKAAIRVIRRAALASH